jgi:hypothetical protein
VVADLLGGDLFSVQQDGETLVAQVPGAVGPGEFEGVADATFSGKVVCCDVD